MTAQVQMIRLGDLCETISGLWTGKKPPFEKATLIRNTNFTKDCKLDLSNVAILDVESKQLQTRTLIPGDLILEKSGGGPKQAVGRVVHFKEATGTYSLSNFTSALRLRDSSKALPIYLQHYLYFQYLSGATETMQTNSTGIRNLNIHQFLDIQVPLTSLSEQQKTVEKLDSALAEIASLETNLGLGMKAANKLFLSILSSALTRAEDEFWQALSLKEICDVDWGNTKLTKSSYVDEGSYLAVSAAGADGLIGHYEHEADVPVLSAIGAQCGRMFFPGARFTAIKNTITLTPKSGITDGKFLYYLFTHVELPQRGAGQPFISKGDIEAFTVRIPKSLETQREIVEKLDSAFAELENLKTQLKKEMEYSSSLRQSILSSAFFKEEKSV